METEDGTSYSKLREFILNGPLKPGTAVPQQELMTALGIGRTPLRQAIQRLQGEGILVDEPRKKLRIAKLGTADLDEILALRILLEVTGTRITVPLYTNEDRDRLTADFEEMNDDDNPESKFRAHHAFHAHLLKYAGNRFIDESRRLREITGWFYRTCGTESGERLLESTRGRSDLEHRIIYDAVLAGDGEHAAFYVGRLLAWTGIMGIAAVDPMYNPVRIRAALQLIEHPVSA